ncbi:hypothetical protein SDJN02_15327 [Cucurbita argyrosperma subsp. argyrosperma]
MTETPFHIRNSLGLYSSSRTIRSPSNANARYFFPPFALVDPAVRRLVFNSHVLFRVRNGIADQACCGGQSDG